MGAWISSHKENIARFQSSGLTSFSQKAILRSILLISAPGPNSLAGPEEAKLRLAGHCRWCWVAWVREETHQWCVTTEQERVQITKINLTYRLQK